MNTVLKHLFASLLSILFGFQVSPPPQEKLTGIGVPLPIDKREVDVAHAGGQLAGAYGGVSRPARRTL